jgi:hypothetical protein
VNLPASRLSNLGFPQVEPHPGGRLSDEYRKFRCYRSGGNLGITEHLRSRQVVASTIVFSRRQQITSPVLLLDVSGEAFMLHGGVKPTVSLQDDPVKLNASGELCHGLQHTGYWVPRTSVGIHAANRDWFEILF